jgi:hypothetical protein
MGMTCRSQIGIVKSSLKWSWRYSLENNKVILFSVTILYCYYYDASCTNFISYIQPGWHAQIRQGTCKFEM